MNFVLGTFSLVLGLGGSVLLLRPFTPHPYLVTLILFLLVRSIGHQVNIGRLKAKIGYMNKSFLLLHERIDSIEFQSTRNKVTWYEVVNGTARNPEGIKLT